MACCNSERCVHFHIFAACLGVLLGISAFAAFGFHYGNHHAAIWAVISAMPAAVCLLLHILYIQEQLDIYYSEKSLNGMALLGFALGLCGLAGLVWYTFNILYYNISFLPLDISKSYYIDIVWAFMTAKWGFMLYCVARRYCSIVGGDYLILVQEDEIIASTSAISA
ncbi:unnamed protein product [Darwinula stevensoni]|uniref:Uncharacterized protein n=1 Tax=Darwinula stevensoni TaxID=69355 RepID=A0A7R8XKU2_9CRUS|nr:unnamed protein product [Darwinula stevensoni]CAG0893506.1 unnamed protein product [Darwinula stevensoni]